jgi:hypothetical protein
MSSANIRLLFESNPQTVMQDSEILKAVKRSETDEEFAKEMQLVSASTSKFGQKRGWRPFLPLRVEL